MAMLYLCYRIGDQSRIKIKRTGNRRSVSDYAGVGVYGVTNYGARFMAKTAAAEMGFRAMAYYRVGVEWLHRRRWNRYIWL